MSRIMVFFCTLAGIHAHTQSILHTEMLGRPTHNSITVQAIFDQTVQACVQYGTTPNQYNSQTPWATFTADNPAEIVLGGLSGNTRYYYRMCYRLPGAVDSLLRPGYTFHTQRPPGSTFTFTVQADPHLDNQTDTLLYPICLQNQLDDSPDFMVDLGDIIMTDKLKNSANVITQDTIIARNKIMRKYYERITHSVPLMMTLGNHEGESGWQLNGNGNNFAVWGTNARKKYYINPGPDDFYTGDETNHPFVGQRENYYAWHWGDALFCVIDPYWYTSPKPDSLHGWRWTLGTAQYNWLKNTLETSNATYKFIFSHQLVGGDPDGRGGIEFADLYEWGGNNLDGTPGFAENRPGWYKPLKDIFKENHVNIFFHGHDHFFAKQEKDCLIYQLVPQPGHPNFSNTNTADDYGYFQGQILPPAGHMRVTVSPGGVEVDYVRAYRPENETATRHNKDVSASYFIDAVNCYDTLSSSTPVIWNNNYADEIIYPNPFSTAVHIEFEIQTGERLFMHIIDAQGKEVRRLLNGQEVSPGKFQMIWDGINDAGMALPAGNYWYILRGEKSTAQKGRLLLYLP